MKVRASLAVLIRCAHASHVVGAAILAKQAYPNYTTDQLQQFLEDNADDLGAVGKDNVFGAGLV